MFGAGSFMANAVLNPLTVSSVFKNIEKLVCATAPKAGQSYLGARWSFAWPTSRNREQLCEYSFPAGPTSFIQLLAARTGLLIAEHQDPDGQALYEHLGCGNAAVVAVDSYHLPYRPAFGRVHSHRTILVKPTNDPGIVWVEDEWFPSYCGPLPAKALDGARYSKVPLERELEPIYAGRPVCGEWFSAKVSAVSMGAGISDWVGALLRRLHDEATTTITDANGTYGPGAVATFRQRLQRDLTSSRPPFKNLRQYSLLLRIEISSRVYLSALLRLASRWIDNPLLHRKATQYTYSLAHMQKGRDVLIKALRQPRPEYAAYISDCLTEAFDAEDRLTDYLDICASPHSALPPI
jgi:hypothetical protein